MTGSVWLFLALVLSSAGALVVGVILSHQVLRHDRDQPLRRRVAVALLWPWAAIDGMRRGRRVAPMLFFGFALVYAVLWLTVAMSETVT